MMDGDSLEPVLLSAQEVEIRLRDLYEERQRMLGPTPDIDSAEVAAYVSELEHETRLLLQIKGLQQHTLLLEGGILGEELRLFLRVFEGAGKMDMGRIVELQLGHLTVKVKIGDWCTLIARQDKEQGVPVELTLDPVLDINGNSPPQAS
jgi:hypothetical protein